MPTSSANPTQALTPGDFRPYRAQLSRGRMTLVNWNLNDTLDRGAAMSSAQQTQPTTRAFARVIGPFLVILTATAVARASAMPTLLTEFRANSSWPWVTGAFVLLSGLVVVALHQYWRGAPAIIVSVLGWLTVVKGFFLMALPQTSLSFAGTAVDAVTFWRVGFIAMALVGLYLTFIGWVPVRSRPTAQPASSVAEVRRAA